MRGIGIRSINALGKCCKLVKSLLHCKVEAATLRARGRGMCDPWEWQLRSVQLVNGGAMLEADYPNNALARVAC